MPATFIQRRPVARRRRVNPVRAFSSEVETGSRQENASNQESRAPFRFNRNGKGSSTLSRAGLVLMILTLPAAALAGSVLPEGFVYLRDIDPTIVQDIRYAGSHNFVGRPIKGYLAAECILSASAANALATVQRKLAAKKLALIVWDCYRPKRAVDDFYRWSKDPTHTEMKTEFYPRTDKAMLFALGYLARRSAHSRGSTVDAGIVPSTFASAPPA